MTSYVSAELRRRVVERAEGLCEYCLVHESDTYLGCQVDHIVSEKHSGAAELDNLAFACTICNRLKGTDLGSLDPLTGQLIRFFNPRADRWADHFELRDVSIHPKTEVGEVTARILGFNSVERLLERQELQDQKRYPSVEALKRMTGTTS
jgi:hypothetical protein